MKRVAVILSLLYLVINPSSSFAARAISIEADKATLFGDEEIILSASPSGFNNDETIYIKGAFYKDGSTNYFGYTKKDDTWVKNGSSATDQRQVKIGNWDQRLVVRSDFTDSGFSGEDNYLLKVGFYYQTSTGALSSVNWSSNAISVNINEPDPTSSPTTVLSPVPTITYSVTTPKITTPTLVLRSTPKISTVAGSFDRIGDFKLASRYANIKREITDARKASQKKEVRVLGAKDHNFSLATITTGFLLIWLGLGAFFFKYLRTKQII